MYYKSGERKGNICESLSHSDYLLPVKKVGSEGKEEGHLGDKTRT